MMNGGINMCMRKLKIGLDCDDVLYKCNSYVIQLENLKSTTTTLTDSSVKCLILTA